MGWKGPGVETPAAMRNHQTGPEETVPLLQQLVGEVRYKDGWTFELWDGERRGEHYIGSEGLTLSVRAQVENSVSGDTVGVHHIMPVPPATWDRRTWERWVLDQILLVERHEAMEFYRVGERTPFFPAHGAGADPYEIRERV
jgi:hypothetical protein